MFRFTIRELMLLTVIVGLATGWILREPQLIAERNHAMRYAAAWEREARYWNAAATGRPLTDGDEGGEWAYFHPDLDMPNRN
jgi:hypothetical protein